MTVEQKIGYFFFDKTLLKRALTRRSYALEQPIPCGHQGAYCALGSLIISTVITELLIRAGLTTESELTAYCSWLQSQETLLAISESLEVEFFIKSGESEKNEWVDGRSQRLIDTLNAVIGGIYFDGGFSAARDTVKRIFQPYLPEEG